jgi:DNA-binding NarL/FixJ family response regulator
MVPPRFWIALLSRNEDLRQRLSAALETRRPWHVAAFGRFEALVTFLRITPVAAVLLDAERAELPLADAGRQLRQDRRLASPLFALIALTATDSALARRALSGDFDAVLPRQAPAGRLVAGVDLAVAPPPRRRPAPPAINAGTLALADAAERREGAEIIPLFGARAKRRLP